MPGKNQILAVTILIITGALFLILHRGAYKGFFTDDELDNISWAPYVRPAVFLKELVNPRFQPDNFRPVGHFYFAEMGRRFQWNYRAYPLPIHVIHLLNVVLIYLVARRLKIPPLGSAAGAVFFGLNMAAFDVFWKPMYVFDALCCLFCLLSLWCYLANRWILALVAFWLAYKSKELAVMLPAVLLLYEYTLGERRWKRLIPFLAISLSFGIQGIVLNPNKDNEYTFRFAVSSLFKTITFYSTRLFFFRYSGLALLTLPLVFWRDRRVLFGIAAMCLFLFPLMFLPGRLFEAYTYLPLTGAALAIAAASSRVHPAIPLALFALWMPLGIHELRAERRAKLAADEQSTPYFAAIRNYAHDHAAPDAFIYDGVPLGMHHWGITGGVNIAWHRTDMHPRYLEYAETPKLLQLPTVTFLHWDAPHKRAQLLTKTPDTTDSAYLKFEEPTPPWQLGTGWYGLVDGRFRWTEPVAAARLFRPAGVTRFEIVANVAPEIIRRFGSATVSLSIDGKPAGRATFRAAAYQTAVLPLVNAPAGEVNITFTTSPVFTVENDPKSYGIAMVAFGFKYH